MEEEQIISAIRSGGRACDEAIKLFYMSNEPILIARIKKLGAREADARDICQDAIIAVYQNIKTQKFKGGSSLLSYATSIARYIWLNKLKRKDREKSIIKNDLNHELISPDHLPKMMYQEKKKAILSLFDELGKDCREILLYSIYYSYSSKELCERLPFQSEQVVRNQKSKCLNKLRKMVTEDPSIVQLIKPDGNE